MFRYLLPILLAFSAPCWGQTITLPETVSGQPGAYIEVPAKTDGEIVKWLALDDGLNVFPASLLKDTKTNVVSALRPGRYRLIAWTAKDGIPSDAAKTVVVVGTPGPNPDPRPDPRPDPDPKPDPKPDGPYWIIFLEESDSRTVEMATILADTVFLKSLTDAGHSWRVYDEDNADAKFFASMTTNRPALIVTTKDGTVVHNVALPKTAKYISDLLKGGK